MSGTGSSIFVFIPYLLQFFRSRAFGCGLFLGVGFGAGVLKAANSTPWQQPAFSARYLVELDPNQKSGNVAWVRICLPDSKWAEGKVIAYNDQGVMVGADLIVSSPKEPVLIRFDCSSQSRQYYLYLGAAGAGGPAWDSAAGVLLEARRGDGKPYYQGADLIAAWNNSPEVLGRSLLNGIFDGGSRFGVLDNIFSHYLGWFDLAKPSQVQVSITATDSTFVLVDGKPVAAWPGKHHFGEGQRGKFRGSVDLQGGLHTIDYYNAYISRVNAWPLLCSLAVKVGEGQWMVAAGNEGFFRPLVHSHVLSYQAESPSVAALAGVGMTPAPALAFDWEVIDQSVLGPDTADAGFIALRLSGYGTDLPGIWSWQFDDGASAEGATVEHLFLRPGVRMVTVGLKNGSGELGTLKAQINVHPNWVAMTTHRPTLVPGQRDQVLGRNLAALPPGDLLSCLRMFEVYEDSEALLKILPAVEAHLGEISDTDLHFVAKTADYLGSWEIRKKVEAEHLWQALIDRLSTGPDLSVNKLPLNTARLHLATLLLENSDQLDETGKMIAAIDPSGLAPGDTVNLQLLIGELALAKGDLEGAKKKLLSLTPTGRGDELDVRSTFRRTANLDQASSYLDRQEFEAAARILSDLQSANPIDTLSGDYALLHIRLLADRGEKTAAYYLAKRILPLIDTLSLRDQFLFKMIDLAMFQGNQELAAKSALELTTRFPYSEETAESSKNGGQPCWVNNSSLALF